MRFEESRAELTAQEPLLGAERRNYSGELVERANLTKLPWWNRPSPWWLLAAMPLVTIALSMTIAPRVEIYTTLACEAHHPEASKQELEWGPGSSITKQASRPANYTLTSSLASIPHSCASDPAVQAVVAKLTAAESISMGVLGCLTTGWWAALSDRKGRICLLMITALGMIISDIIYILVTHFWRRLPGGYWLIVLGPIIDGLLGGASAVLVGFNAYIADTTAENDRSRMLSISLGLQFAGASLGPMIGGLAIHFTGQIISVYYIATIIHLLFGVFVCFVTPESLTPDKMVQAQLEWDEQPSGLAHSNGEHATGTCRGWGQRQLGYASALLRPLLILKPGLRRDGNLLKPPQRDWNLLILAASLGSLYVLAGEVPYRFQYATLFFGWSSEQNGYWLSLATGARALYLTLILPFILRFLRPPPRIVEIQASSSRQLDGYETVTKEVDSPRFELGLARLSAAMDASSYIIMLAVPSPASLVVLGVLTSVGAGFPPAIQSVMLALYLRDGGKEVGRLLGALGVMQILCSQVIAPALYGLIYVKSVAICPLAIFITTLSAILGAFFILGFVRLPQNEDDFISSTSCSIGRGPEVIRSSEEPNRGAENEFP